jgi:hypothetical protein
MTTGAMTSSSTTNDDDGDGNRDVTPLFLTPTERSDMALYTSSHPHHNEATVYQYPPYHGASHPFGMPYYPSLPGDSAPGYADNTHIGVNPRYLRHHSHSHSHPPPLSRPFLQQPFYYPDGVPQSEIYNQGKYNRQQHKQHKQPPWQVPVTKQQHPKERGGVMPFPRPSSSSAFVPVGPCSPYMTESFTLKGHSVLVRHKKTQNAAASEKDKDNTILDKNETGKSENKASEALLDSPYGKTAVQRAGRTVKRQRVPEIQDTQLENWTPEENRLLQATEQVRKKKNDRARARLQEAKHKVQAILAKSRDQRSAIEQAFLEKHTANKERKLHADRLRRVRLKLFGIKQVQKCK